MDRGGDTKKPTIHELMKGARPGRPLNVEHDNPLYTQYLARAEKIARGGTGFSIYRVSGEAGREEKIKVSVYGIIVPLQTQQDRTDGTYSCFYAAVDPTGG